MKLNECYMDNVVYKNTILTKIQRNPIWFIWQYLAKKTTPRKRNGLLFRNSNSITRIMATDVCFHISIVTSCFRFGSFVRVPLRCFFFIFKVCFVSDEMKHLQIYLMVCLYLCVYWNGETYTIGCYNAWNLIMTISPIELHWIINLGTRSSIQMNTKKILLINKQKTCACQVVCFPNSTHQVKWSVLEGLCVSIFFLLRSFFFSFILLVHSYF